MSVDTGRGDEECGSVYVAAGGAGGLLPVRDAAVSRSFPYWWVPRVPLWEDVGISDKKRGESVNNVRHVTLRWLLSGTGKWNLYPTSPEEKKTRRKKRKKKKTRQGQQNRQDCVKLSKDFFIAKNVKVVCEDWSVSLKLRPGKSQQRTHCQVWHSTLNARGKIHDNSA